MSKFLLTFATYLIGSLSFGIIASKFSGLKDPRTYSSCNPGATNVLRSGNKTAAALTLLGDCLKGYLSAYLVQRYGVQYGLGEFGSALALVSTLLGHLWPIFFQFSGGKGVATLLGILVGINVLLGILVAVVWLAIAYIFRYSSVASLASIICCPFLYYLMDGIDADFLAITVMSILVFWRHRKNIKNLLSGRESRIGARRS